MADKPWLRRLVVRIPKALQPKPRLVARVLGVDASGQIRHHLYDETGEQYHFITSVQERAGRLYLASIKQDAFAHLPRP